MAPLPTLQLQHRDDDSPLRPYDVVMLVLGIIPVLALLFNCVLWISAQVADWYTLWKSFSNEHLYQPVLGAMNTRLEKFKSSFNSARRSLSFGKGDANANVGHEQVQDTNTDVGRELDANAGPVSRERVADAGVGRELDSPV